MTLTNENFMKTKHLLIAVACLFCLALPLLSGCANKDEGEDVRMVERQIGDTFKIRNVRDYGHENFSLIMYVTIRKEDERAFDRQYEQARIELIDRVTAVLYASTTEEREAMTAIKERVEQTINEVLGTPWVQQVLFTEITLEVE